MGFDGIIAFVALLVAGFSLLLQARSYKRDEDAFAWPKFVQMTKLWERTSHLVSDIHANPEALDFSTYQAWERECRIAQHLLDEAGKQKIASLDDTLSSLSAITDATSDEKRFLYQRECVDAVVAAWRDLDAHFSVVLSYAKSRDYGATSGR